MTTTTRNWKFFLERDDVWDVRLFGGGDVDDFVGLQVGRWALGIEALDDGRVGWSTPWRWLREQLATSLDGTGAFAWSRALASHRQLKSAFTAR